MQFDEVAGDGEAKAGSSWIACARLVDAPATPAARENLDEALAEQIHAVGLRDVAIERGRV